MIPRTALRTTQRAVRVNRNAIRRNARFESTTSKVTPDTAAGSGGASGAITGGLAGGGAALLAVYGWYHFSGTKSAVQTAKQTKAYVDSATESLKVSGPKQHTRATSISATAPSTRLTGVLT